MRTEFWTNTIWYILLGITSAISLGVILYKAKNRWFITAFMLAVITLTYYTEFGLLAFTDAYRYYPKLSTDSYLDSVFGNYFSQFSISTTGVLAVVLGLGYKWNIVFALLYYLIEQLFLRLGIFKHNWYHTWITFTGILLLYLLLQKWYQKMQLSNKNFIYNITLFLASVSAYYHMGLFVSYHCSIKSYEVHITSEYYRDMAIALFFELSIPVLLMLLLYLWKTNWRYKGVVFVLLFAARYILYKAGIVQYKDHWFFLVTVYDLFGLYFVISLMDYLLSKNRNELQIRRTSS